MTIHILTDAVAPPCARTDFHSPLKLKRGGPYGWLTPYLSLMAQDNAAIAANILSLNRDELHFIAMTLAFSDDLRRDRARLGDFARAIGNRRREAIVREFAPDADPRLARFASKLAGKPWRAVTYHRLAALAAEPHARKTLGHLPSISRRNVVMLSRLPAAYRTRGVLRMIRRRRDFSRVLFAIEIVRRVRTDLSDRQILASLEHAESDYIRRWVDAHYERLPFPPAPTGALSDGRGGVLRPILSGAELKRAGFEFDNCVFDYIPRAASGAIVFYRYDRDDIKIAAIKLLPVAGLGWAIDEISGPQNNPVSGADRLAIIGAFAAAGVRAPPQAYSEHCNYDLEW